MDGYLPIYKFSEVVGKSKQSIYKKLKKDDSPLAGFTKEVDGKIYISFEAIKEVYGIEGYQPDFQPNQPENQPEQPEIKPIQPDIQQNNSTIQPENQPHFQPVNQQEEQKMITFLMEQLSQKEENEKRLNDIIASKDKQIKEQAEELAQLANKLATIANNALLTTAQIKYISSSSTESQQIEDYPTEEKEEISIQQAKKSLFRKFIDLFK